MVVCLFLVIFGLYSSLNPFQAKAVVGRIVQVGASENIVPVRENQWPSKECRRRNEGMVNDMRLWSHLPKAPDLLLKPQSHARMMGSILTAP